MKKTMINTSMALCLMLMLGWLLPLCANETKAAALKVELDELDKKIKDLKSKLERKQIYQATSSHEALSGLLTSIQSKEKQVQAMRDRISVDYRAHPDVVKMLSELKALEKLRRELPKDDQQGKAQKGKEIAKVREKMKAARMSLFKSEYDEVSAINRSKSVDLKQALKDIYRDSAQLDEQTSEMVKSILDLHAQRERTYLAWVKASGKVLPQDWLRSLEVPQFKEGHKLPKLTRFGWVLPYEIREPLAQKYGYACQIEGYLMHKTIDKINDPESDEYKIVQLYKSNPDFHRIAIILNRHFPETAPEGTWCRDKDGNLLSSSAKSYDGTEWHSKMKTTISPLAPNELWEQMGKGRAAPLRELKKIVPIHIILNGGEYGLGVKGFAGKVWNKDPRVVKAVKDSGGDWFDYLSQVKTRSENIIADIVCKAVPDRELYVYYVVAGGEHRMRWGGWKAWTFDYKHFRTVGDTTSAQHYVSSMNSGYLGGEDILTLGLNNVGIHLRHGDKLAYSWFWSAKKPGDMRRYRGLLKMVFLLGTTGGNAGSYHNENFMEPFDPEHPPAWLAQMVELSRVQALFSHLEEDLKSSDLVAGPHLHSWSRDNPAYELLPHELSSLVSKKNGEEVLNLGRPVRVIARKRSDGQSWLVGAWSADGLDANVTVTIPEGGDITLLARDVGSVYLVKKQGSELVAHMFDPDEDHPSRGFVPASSFVTFQPKSIKTADFSDDIHGWLKKASHLEAWQKNSEAAPAYLKVAELAPRERYRVSMLFKAAKHSLESKEYETAVRVYEHTLQRPLPKDDKRVEGIYRYCANSLRALKKYEQSIEANSKILTLTSINEKSKWRARQFEGLVLLHNLKDFDRAEKVFKELERVGDASMKATAQGWLKQIEKNRNK